MIGKKLEIKYLPIFREVYAKQGKYYRIRYRGPRNTVLDRGRSKFNRASTCLKANATHFTVYEY